MKKILATALAALMVLSMGACSTPKAETPAPTAAPEQNASEAPTDATQESAAAESAAPAPDADKKIKVAMCQGTRGDKGFNDQAYMGIEKAAAELGIEFDTYESGDLTEIDAALRNYASTGEYDLIISVGSNHADPIALVAADFPDQKFSLVDTILPEPLPNVHSTAAIDAEQAFLSGVISGIVTKGEYNDVFTKANADKNVIAYAGGMDNPTSRAGAAGYMAGVAYVNPDCKVIYTIVGNYNDPVKAKEIATNGVAQGADIITGNCGSSSLGLNEAAKEANCYFIATSPAGLDPEYSLCTSVKLTENMIYDEVKSIVEGTWTSGGERQGIAAGYCDVSIEGVGMTYPQALLDTVAKVKQDVVDGKIKLPADVSELDAWKAANQFAG